MAITPSRQRNAVSEGMALGLVLCGRTRIPADKLAVDLSFSSAFRSWVFSDRFPRVASDLSRRLDGMRVMTHAIEGNQVWVLYWASSGTDLEIRTRQADWDPDNDNDVDYALGMIDGDVPRHGWVALARDFLWHMERKRRDA